MTACKLEPPALSKRLLAWLLPAGAGGLTILGDLLEGFRERAEKDGVRAARRWYRWQALTLAIRIAANPDRPRRLMAQTVWDLKLAWRSISRAPGIMLAIVLTIGLAVGVNTALFSVFDGLLFRPLPYTDADRIVHVALNPAARASLPKDEFAQMLGGAGRTPSLVDRAIATPATLLDRSGAAVTDWGLRTYKLSASAFDLLGIQPMLGRRFVAGDRSGSRDAVLLGYDIWQSRFGGDAGIVGRSVQIPGTAPDERWHIVGVMPPGFSFPEGANFWVPDDTSLADPVVTPYARLAPGVTLESVRAELPHLTVTPLREYVRPQGATALALLLAGTTLMLLVAWVQVAALLFARATGRAAEIGVRLALGATRARLMRQFSLEAAVLLMLALGLAASIGPAITAWIAGVLPAEMTLGQHVAPDIRAFLFAAVLSAIGLLALVLLPVDLIRRCSPALLLRGTAAGAIFRRATRVRTALFVGQLAIATSLVYLTSLAAQSLVKVTDASLGFAPTDLYAIRMPRGDNLFAGSARARSEQRGKVVTETIEAMRRLPGVRGVTGANSWPLQLDGMRDETFVLDADPTRTPLEVRRGSILPGYPGVLGLSLLAGAEPTESDLARITREPRAGEPWFALANQTLARQLERSGPVVGQVLGGRYQITGVMPDVILERPDQRIEPTILLYLPPIASVNVLLFRLEPTRTVEQVGVPGVLERLWQAPAPRPFPVTDAVTLAASHYRARTLLLGLVAILTVPLTMIGVAGALTYTMKQRAREIAIELAIGADPRALRGRIIRRTMAAATAAVAIGLALGIVTGRVMSTALFGVHAADPIAITVSMAMVLVVAWVAAVIPAHRAGRFSLTAVLRES